MAQAAVAAVRNDEMRSVRISIDGADGQDLRVEPEQDAMISVDHT